MTLSEAEYVVKNRHAYDDATFHFALEVIDHAERGTR